jgi:hypothetical protein
MIRPAFAALLLAACLLVAALARELGTWSALGPADVPHARVPAVASPAAVPDHTADWVNAILTRPLFSPDRRPTGVATAAAGGRSEADGLPRLTGVLVGPFGRHAIFARSGEKPLVVAEGDKINGWTVRSIDIDTVKINGSDGVMTLHPSFGAFGLAPNNAVPAGQPIGHSPRR